MSKRIDVLFYLMLLALIAIAYFSIPANAKPCKATVTKTDPRVIQHDVLENPNWICQHMGTDAKTKLPVFFCTNKRNGVHVEMRVLDDGKK